MFAIALRRRRNGAHVGDDRCGAASARAIGARCLTVLMLLLLMSMVLVLLLVLLLLLPPLIGERMAHAAATSMRQISCQRHDGRRTGDAGGRNASSACTASAREASIRCVRSRCNVGDERECCVEH
jgi:hypothetical protein